MTPRAEDDAPEVRVMSAEELTRAVDSICGAWRERAVRWEAIARQLGDALAGFMPVAGRWLELTDFPQPMDLVLRENASWNSAAAALSVYRDAIKEDG